MSTLEEAVVSRLKADAGVQAITTAVYPVIAPETVEPPYLVYQVVSAPELEVAEYVRPRIQVTAWAATYGQAVQLANAVRSCFYAVHVTVSGVHFRAYVSNVMDGEHDVVSGRYSRIVDVFFDYRNPL